jgi:hypothetical protein
VAHGEYQLDWERLLAFPKLLLYVGRLEYAEREHYISVFGRRVPFDYQSWTIDVVAGRNKFRLKVVVTDDSDVYSVALVYLGRV